MAESTSAAADDWRPETDRERQRRLARTWTFADRLRWLEEQTLLIDHLHAQRRAQGLRCFEGPEVPRS